MTPVRVGLGPIRNRVFLPRRQSVTIDPWNLRNLRTLVRLPASTDLGLKLYRCKVIEPLS